MPITRLGLVLLSLIKKHVDVLVLPDSLGVVTVGIRGGAGVGMSPEAPVVAIDGMQKLQTEVESKKTWEDKQKHQRRHNMIH